MISAAISAGVAISSVGISLALALMEVLFQTLPADVDRVDLSTGPSERRRVSEAITRFAETAAAVDVCSYDREVLDLTLTFRQTSGKVPAAIVFREPQPDDVLKEVSQLVQELRDACRRYLGFDPDGAGPPKQRP